LKPWSCPGTAEGCGVGVSAPIKASSAGFWRKVGVVLSGTAVAQAIPILGSLVIARLVVPAQFGVFAAWLGLAALAAVVITGRYENALALEHDGAPRRMAALAILGLALAAALLLSVLLLLAWWLLPSLSARLPAGMLLLLPPAAWVIAAAQIWQSWAAAEGRYAALSSMRIAQSIAVTGGQIALGLVAPSAVSLALAHAVGVGLGLGVAAWHLSPRPWPAAADARAFFARHRRFPQWSLPADSINTAAGQLPVILVATRFGAEAAGLLALTLRTLGAPIALLGSAVLDVFKRRAAQAFRERGQCRAEYLETLRVLALASVVVTLVIGLAGEPIFALAFGESWRRAGTIAIWLLPMFALRFVASPLSYMFYIANKQPVDLAWQCALLLLTLAALLLPAQHEAALQFYSLGYSALYLVYLALSYRFSLGARP
jgi:O-antigen/teichoic acid export membrane protein